VPSYPLLGLPTDLLHRGRAVGWNPLDRGPPNVPTCSAGHLPRKAVTVASSGSRASRALFGICPSVASVRPLSGEGRRGGGPVARSRHAMSKACQVCQSNENHPGRPSGRISRPRGQDPRGGPLRILVAHPNYVQPRRPPRFLHPSLARTGSHGSQDCAGPRRRNGTGGVGEAIIPPCSRFHETHSRGRALRARWRGGVATAPTALSFNLFESSNPTARLIDSGLFLSLSSRPVALADDPQRHLRSNYCSRLAGNRRTPGSGGRTHLFARLGAWWRFASRPPLPEDPEKTNGRRSDRVRLDWLEKCRAGWLPEAAPCERLRSLMHLGGPETVGLYVSPISPSFQAALPIRPRFSLRWRGLSNEKLESERDPSAPKPLRRKWRARDEAVQRGRGNAFVHRHSACPEEAVNISNRDRHPQPSMHLGGEPSWL
jgi:hypothetical protein